MFYVLLLHELLDHWDCFSMGYREFMFELFDENLLFLDSKLFTLSHSLTHA